MGYPSPTTEPRSPCSAKEPWKVLIVDDDPATQALTQQALRDLAFDGRNLHLLQVTTAGDARTVLRDHRDIAVALIDLIIENPYSGLELVEHIRKELGNPHMRLIIRTSQSDIIPEDEVINHYDIDDYKDLAEEDPGKLRSTVRYALKAYRDIMTIEHNRRGLERILESSSGPYLAGTACINEFMQELLTQVSRICCCGSRSGRSCTSGFIYSFNDGGHVQASIGHTVVTDHMINTCSMLLLGERTTDGPGLRDGELLLALGNRGQAPLGFIHLATCSPLDPDAHNLIQILVHRATSALQNLKLHEDLKQANRESLYMLAVAAEFKDQDTGHHIRRIARQSRLLASELGLSDAQAAEIGEASMLHDIGKLAIPDAILQKPGPLTNEEFDTIREHPVIGAQILGQHPGFQLAKEIALHHHERWDGGGYPHGLKGTEIPLAARIVSVVDVFDALFHNRPYKAAWNIDDCVAQIQRAAGSQFDPDVTDAFLRLLDRECPGLLDNARAAVHAAD